jgi:hypothetical protein
MSKPVEGSGPVQVPHNNQPPQQPSFKERAGRRWACIKTKGGECLASNKFLVAMTIVGLLGLAVAGVGTTGLFAHMHMLPAQLAKLNALGAMGNYAIAAMVAGGVMTLIGIAATIVLAKRFIDKKKETEREKERIINDATAKIAEQQKLANQQFLAKQESFKALPGNLKDAARNTNTGCFRAVLVAPEKRSKSAQYTIIASLPHTFKLYENIPEEKLEEYKQNLTHTGFKAQTY